MTERVLVVRLDGMGDVLLAGPAVRAVAAAGAEVTMLVGPAGTAAARLLPGIRHVLTWTCPWVVFDPPSLDAAEVGALVDRLRDLMLDAAVVLTSFHQSPLPTALVLRLAGVRRISAISVDYPGSLLDVRHRVPDDIPEAERALSLAAAAGFELPPDDDGRLRLSGIGHDADAPPTGRIVVHPGTSAPARAWSAQRHRQTVTLLNALGYDVAVTGGPHDAPLTALVAGDDGRDLGLTSLATLARTLADADAVIVGNTGPAHLAAAVGTPVVSLFAPTVSARAWAPYRVPSIVLGDQHAACRATRARSCPIDGHPCLESVTADDVVRAVQAIAPPPVSRAPVPTPRRRKEGVHQ